MERAKQAAGQIFSSYPDWGKAPKEYLATVIEHLSGYSDQVLAALSHKDTGIATRSKFLPTVAEIKAFANEAIDSLNTSERYAQARRRHAYLPAPRTPFRPFPQLWAAFQDEPEIIALLDKAPNFAVLDDIGRILATRGKEEARKAIV